LNRRRFLLGSSALGIAAGLAPNHVFDLAYAQGTAPVAPDWEKLADNLVGPLLRRKDSPFVRFVAPYNLAYNKQTLWANGIALCASPADVVTAINWARDSGVPLVARSGGHSYAGYSMTSGLLIDLTTMRGASWDPIQKTVTATGGVRNSDVTAMLRSVNRAITHGRCPTVGTAGFLLGGGIGFNMRLHGVGIDYLRASEIVTADGELRPLSARDNDDLFWACRGGGGGNFGINTSFTVETYDAPDITVFKYNWSGTQTEMGNVAFALMSSLSQAPDEFGTRFAITAPNPVRGVAAFGVNIVGQYRGAKATAERYLKPAVDAKKPTTAEIEHLPYWQAQDILLDTDKPFYFHERSAFLTKPLSRNTFAQACDQLAKWRGTDDSDPRYKDQRLFADFRFFQTGGVMNKVPSGDTAFVHRDSIWLMDIGLPWSAADPPERVNANIAWQNAFFAQMLPFSNRQSYQNFIDPALENPAQAYYGTNLDRLRRVKRKYDPDNLFKFAQSIPPAA
jgi:hypothetical protein